ncbi:hypothetical protein D6C78_05216 [Aureobasidium pullulans]|uniref:Transcription factor domain-containing protein n=1 Tax=Aureobasidium pullulans TaxID=5580 RepID=A0A4T0BPW6_AURPU|nr:hypothetical protein D6C78_05216 [Aureobasidium pullulans]
MFWCKYFISLAPEKNHNLTFGKCNHRGKECVYVQSRRGGARVPRSKRQDNEKADYVKIAQECFDESVPTMVKPGAGLTQLDLSLDNTDNLFDSIFTAAPLPQPIELDETPRAAGSVRRYHCDGDILDAYYIWLHPFFPILPPSEATHPKDNPQLWFPESSACTFEPRSPASLAISAILALIPHPEEGAPFSEESIKARREAAHHFAKRTIESIECDSEMPDSSISPAQALVNGYSHISRPAFHSRYICVCQASIVSSAPPAIPLFDSRFTTSFPQASDPEAWPFFIKSQQTILLATQFVSAVGRAVDGREDWTDISTRMQELHNTIEPLIAQANTWTDIKPVSTDPEAMIAYSLKQMSKIKLNSARIKLHRYSAFFDIPVFSEKHCDLKKSEPFLPPSSSTTSDPLDTTALTNSPSPQSCGCSSSSSLPLQLPTLTSSSVSPPNSTSSASTMTEYLHPFPFSSHDSSRLCLNSALAIAAAFSVLPLPSATGPLLPRTMPSFACCAMQSAYALLMVYHRTWVLCHQQEQADGREKAEQLLDRCEAGLRAILEALGNYSVAFEALGGMRDQIQAAVDCLRLGDDEV